MKPKLLNKIINNFSKEIDQQSLKIKKIYDAKDSLERMLLTVQEELIAEEKIIEYNIELRQYFQIFYKTNKSRQNNISNEIHNFSALLKAEEAVLIDLKKEQMKYEKLLDNYNSKQAEKQRKDELKELDEFNVINYSTNTTEPA